MAQTEHDFTLPGQPDMAQMAADDLALAGYFAAARDQPPEPDAALMTQVLAAGLAEQTALAAARKPPVAIAVAVASARRRPGNWFHGWGAATGLVSATLAGLWLGFSPPAGLAGLADGVLGTSMSGSAPVVDQIDLLPSFETYLAEG